MSALQDLSRRVVWERCCILQNYHRNRLASLLDTSDRTEQLIKDRNIITAKLQASIKYDYEAQKKRILARRKKQQTKLEQKTI